MAAGLKLLVRQENPAVDKSLDLMGWRKSINKISRFAPILSMPVVVFTADWSLAFIFEQTI